MRNISLIKNREGFVGLALILMSLMIMIISSLVLFNFFYLFFRIGKSVENTSTNYETLSSGVYCGVWALSGNHANPAYININGTMVQIDLAVPQKIGDPYGIIVYFRDHPGTKITCQYNGAITSWASATSGTDSAGSGSGPVGPGPGPGPVN